MLHIRVTVLDANQNVTPVTGYTILISDNPATAPPREVKTSAAGTADVKLPPGNYTVESDEPFIFRGKAYTWTRTLDVSGADATVEFTSSNAEIASADSVRKAAPVLAPNATGAKLLEEWQGSLVELWTQTTHASGFVVDASGLVATNQRVVNGVTSVEVQLTPALKVAGTVVTAEPGRDVAVIRIDPAALANATPVPLSCAATPPSPEKGQQVFALGAPMRQARAVETGTLGRVGPHALESDLDFEPGSVGGPVMTGEGAVLGLTSIVDGSDERRPDYRVIRTGDICAVVASARRTMTDAAPPSGAHLPVEPERAFPGDLLESAGKLRAGSFTPYQTSSEFEVAFITPIPVYAARNRTRRTSLPERTMRTREADPEAVRRQEGLFDFGRWSQYVADYPPVLLVRITPRLKEGFWTMIARGAAQTQGLSLPAVKHFTSGFARLQAFCGAKEVIPIHPFLLDRQVSDTTTISEGLYVFDPAALAPSCGTVKLALYSQRSPNDGDTLVVENRFLQQAWEDFAAYRDAR